MFCQPIRLLDLSSNPIRDEQPLTYRQQVIKLKDVQVYGDMYESADLAPPLRGPQPLGVVVTSDNATLTITFDAELEPVLREEDRFMICCLVSMDQCDSHHYNEAHHFI